MSVTGRWFWWYYLCLVTLNISYLQGYSASVYVVADSVWSTANFFSDFVRLPSIFQANLNQNSLIIGKMFPFFVFSCGRIYMIHSDNSFGWLLIWYLHSTTKVYLWIFYLIVQLDYTINLLFRGHMRIKRKKYNDNITQTATICRCFSPELLIARKCISLTFEYE